MIIFLYGADTFRARRFLKELKAKFIKDLDPGAFSLSTLDGAGLTIDKLGQQISTGSLFVKKRLVIIENIFQSKKDPVLVALLSYLQKLEQKDTDRNILIFREEKSWPLSQLTAGGKKLWTWLNQQQHVQEFKPLSGSSLLSFIQKEATLYKQKISLDGAKELAARTGGDSWLIAQAIKKLSHYQTQAPIDKQSVMDMIPAAYDENIFALTDALGARQKKLASRLLAEQYAAGLSEDYILNMLIRHFKILNQLRLAGEQNSSPAQLSAKLKLHPFVVKKSLSQARNFTPLFLSQTFNKLVHLDYLHKLGRGNIKSELMLLISQI